MAKKGELVAGIDEIPFREYRPAVLTIKPLCRKAKWRPVFLM